VLRPDPRLRGATLGAARDAAGPPTGGIPGCVYAARCPYVIERCRVERPEMRAVAPDHLARCHRAEELSLTPLPRRPAARSA
jgi:ABC-type dipeptide/oligopeptide/nickel transport system ATPase component